MDRNEMGRCLVIGAGDLSVTQISKQENDYVIAVDGGITYLPLLELEPDIIIGDFDSVTTEQKEAIIAMKEQDPESVIILDEMKDDTDMLAALRLGLKKGYTFFQIYGATGGRLEHTLANIQCLLYLKKHGALGYIMDGTGMIFVLKDEEVKFKENMEGMLSLFSLNGQAIGVTISGMKYELDGEIIRNDFPMGISNEFIGKEAAIIVEKGELVGIITYIQESEKED